MNLGIYLSRTAAYTPDHTALVCGDQRWTYAQLDSDSSRLATALQGAGLGLGAAVATIADNCGELVVAEMTMCKAGFLRVPISARLAPVEIEHVLVDSAARAVFVGPRHREVVAEIIGRHGLDCCIIEIGADGPAGYRALLARGEARSVVADVAADHPAVLNFTSGSTGTLKAAVQTVGNRLANMRKVAMNSELHGADEVYLAPGPITHASGMGILSCFFHGATVVVLPAFSPSAYLETLEREKVTNTFLVPTMLNMVLAEPSLANRDLSALRSVTLGGAPVSPARLREAVEAFGPVVNQGYGQGETTSAITFLSTADVMRGLHSDPELLLSCGRPIFDTEVRVVDETGAPLPAGEVGEVVARGDDCVREYFHAPEVSAETFRNGWVHTGDLGRFREDGFLFLVDRKKDMIVSGGYNVYCLEVESALYAHPAVFETCVYGVPDEKWGEAVRAAVVLKPGFDASADELIEACAQLISRVKIPRRIDFHTELPKNRNGKIDRRTLRDRSWADADRLVG
ncbi:MAG: AMP-binding protein [Gordonia sp. (in: high G+C Gram-positive bacteria)]|uniref:class I adenylate-forming enzyme family protein n=1 Tax=Gordonia sp. (in: high G+C Gram-positive bacteria) TaxID=84139 RepID=UPI003C72CF6F